MMRSMYAGVSGLRNHQLRMDVIGNNVANVNTYGFKKSRVVFKDALYQTMRGGSAPQGDRGGTNPMGIGLGVALGSIDLITTAGSTQTTGKNTDLAIDGNGYFVLQSGGERFYTRAGNFDFDKLGNYLSPGNGLRVMGWMADLSNNWSIDTTKSIQPIDISSYKTINPVKTSEVRFQGNCDATLSPLIGGATQPPADYVTKLTSKDVYDSLGNVTTVYFRFEKIYANDQLLPGTGTGDNWTTPGTARPGTIWRVRASTDPTCPAPDYTSGNSASTDYYLAFDENGNLYDSVVWPSTAGNPPADNALDWTTNILPLFQADTTLATEQNLQLIFPGTTAGVSTPQDITLDFTNLKQHNATHTADPYYQDGFTKGDLRSVSVDQSGTILGTYSNGLYRNLGQIALATFQNPAGLLAKGGNLFQESNNSGDAKIGAPGTEDIGVIIPGSLEMSNVDLSEEFTDMIVTQRGFQANSRVITTSDEMLQELVNIKR